MVYNWNWTFALTLTNLLALAAILGAVIIFIIWYVIDVHMYRRWKRSKPVTHHSTHTPQHNQEEESQVQKTSSIFETKTASPLALPDGKNTASGYRSFIPGTCRYNNVMLHTYTHAKTSLV